MINLFVIPPFIILIIIFSLLFLDGRDLMFDNKDKKEFLIGTLYLSGTITLIISIVYWMLLLIIFGIKYLLN